MLRDGFLELEAVEVRHPVVQNGDVETLTGRDPFSSLPGRCQATDLVGMQEGPHRTQHMRVVVHDDHSGHLDLLPPAPIIALQARAVGPQIAFTHTDVNTAGSSPQVTQSAYSPSSS